MDKSVLKILQQIREEITGINNDLKRFATKDDLKSFATKDDLKSFPTKKDLQEGLDKLLADVVHAVDKTKADKKDVKELEKRVDKIEGQIFS